MNPPDLAGDAPGAALLEKLMIEFHEGAAAAFPRPPDPFFSDAWKAFDGLSVKDRLDQMDLSADHRALLEGTLGASCCAPFAESGFVEMLRWWALSGRNLQSYSDSVARFKLRDGTVALIDAMIEDGKPDVLLGSPVARVEQDANEARVTTEQGRTFRARAVVAALPMNVLAKIEFSPALDPAKLAASRERHAGSGVKLYACVRGEVPNFAAFAPEAEPLSMIFTSEAGKEGGVLIAFGTSPKQIDNSASAVAPFVPAGYHGDRDERLRLAPIRRWHLVPARRRHLAAARARRLVHFPGDMALGWRGFIDGPSSGNQARTNCWRLGPHHAASEAPGATPLPAAELAGGEDALRQCAVCHPSDASGRHGVGPNLRGVVGREIAIAPEYPFSPALQSLGGHWSPPRLDAFLTNPLTHAPGTKMAFGGVANEENRAALIEALSKLR